jgi:hypothetical protein
VNDIGVLGACATLARAPCITSDSVGPLWVKTPGVVGDGPTDVDLASNMRAVCVAVNESAGCNKCAEA